MSRARPPRKTRKFDLDAGRSMLSSGNQQRIERLLKKAADKAAQAAKRQWTKSGRNPFSRHGYIRHGGIEPTLEKALIGALTLHANNSGPRPSIRMTAPDTGGRPFHFSHTTVSASGGSKAYKAGTAAAHMSYINRESAVEQAMLEEGVELSLSSREIDEEAFGRDPAERMQDYIEDAAKVEAAKAAAPAQAPQPLAFTFGNISDSKDERRAKEERRAFWELVEKHPERGNSRLQSRVILELPVESTPAQRLRIVEEYVKGLAARGLRYHAALHAPTDKNDPRNFHAHVIYMTRPAKMVPFAFDGLDDGTDKPKGLVWDFACVAYLPDAHKHRRRTYPKRKPIHPDTRSETFIPDERKRLADIVNTVMAEAGNPVRYDPRSYKAMGIEVDAMKSISRIIKDKAKAGDRVVLDFAQTKRDIEAEIQRLARERAPDFAEVSKIRVAVRAGDRALRQLEKEGAFLKGKPILRRGVHTVKTFVKRKALDYARTRALHVERSIEAAQQIRSVERVIEATNPEVIAQLRAKLARNLLEARAKGNKNEVARLKKEMDVVPHVAHASLLNKVAREEVEQLRSRHERHGALRLAKVRQALREWGEAALGAKPDMTPSVRAEAGRVGGIEIGSRPVAAPAANARPPRQPPPNSYDEMIDQAFKTPFHRYMWDVTRRYSQFIMDNADPNVPGRTAVDLTNKLVEAIKVHPVKADELIMSYRFGNPDAGPSNVPAWKPPERRADATEAAPQPVFKQKARMPVPEPDEVMPYPRDLGVPEHKPPIIAEPRAPEPRRKVEKAEEPVVPQVPLADREAETPLKPRPKERDKRKKRQKAILAQRVMER